MGVIIVEICSKTPYIIVNLAFWIVAIGAIFRKCTGFGMVTAKERQWSKVEIVI